MNKIAEKLYFAFNIFLVICIIILYFFGAYKLVTEDKYTFSQAGAGIIGIPYGIYIGFGEFMNSFKSYDLYPYTVDQILTAYEIHKLEQEGYSKRDIERKAYISLVSVLNKVKEEYRTDDFLERFHNKDISFQELTNFTD